MGTSVIILAAGKGTRMQSDLPKVLHELAGVPLLVHAMASAASLAPDRSVIVAGHGAEAVATLARATDPEATVVVQDAQLGTGHAVLQARDALAGVTGPAFVLFADTPHIQADTLHKMEAALETADVVVLGFEAADPGRYGRLVTDGDRLEKIVEFKDATDEQRAITLCNSGVLAADTALLMELLAAVENDNAAGEYYLTDVPGLARARGLTATVVLCDEAETLGVNSKADLAAAEAVFQNRARAMALADGVTLQAPDTVIFAQDTVVGRDAVIEPNVVFGAGVTVETGARIRAFTHLEECHIARGATVGPFARVRGGAELSEDVKIGNFVELKNAILGEGVKVSHLSYVGDASVGQATNIGAGTVTCNYDGVSKHRTTIGERAFIGSNTMLVAPVTVGDEAMTASGSVITRDVPEGDLAVARGRQDNKPGFARKLLARLRAAKGKG